MNCAFKEKEYTVYCESFKRYTLFRSLYKNSILMKILSLNHSTYQHQYHIVWWTKWRRKFLKPYVWEYLLFLFRELQEKYPNIEIIHSNSDEDNIHIQITIPPNLTVAEVVQKIKSYTSLRLRKKFKFIKKMYLKSEWIWAVGYFSSTIGLNEKLIQSYIESQGKEDIPKRQTHLEFL